MTKSKPYFDLPALTALLLDHGGRNLEHLADMVDDDFAPEKVLSNPVAFTLLQETVSAWCYRNHMKPGPWLYDYQDGRAALVAVGRYLQDGITPEAVPASRLAGAYLASPSTYPDAAKYFASVYRRIESFSYDREIALKAGGTKTALRQIAHAYGEAEGFDGVASICPAIRHEAAGLVLDSLKKSFNPSIF